MYSFNFGHKNTQKKYTMKSSVKFQAVGNTNRHQVRADLQPGSGGFVIRPLRILGFAIRTTLLDPKTHCATITFNNPSIPA